MWGCTQSIPTLEESFIRLSSKPEKRMRRTKLIIFFIWKGQINIKGSRPFQTNPNKSKLKTHKMGEIKRLKDSFTAGQYSNYSQNVEKAMAEAYSKYGNTKYWNQFASIPSLNLPSYINADYVSWGTSDWVRDIYNQYETSALSAINQLYGTIREEEYNSANEQTTRERAAGLNPDLTGNVNAGTATEFDDVASKMELPSAVAAESARIQNISSIAQTGINFCQQFIGLASSFQGLKTGNLQNAGLELGLQNDATTYAQEWLASHASIFEDLDLTDKDDLSKVPELIEQAFTTDEANMPMTKKAKKVLLNAFKAWSSPNLGVEGKIEALRKAFADNRSSRMKTMSSPLWDNDAGRMLSKVIDGFGNLDYAVWKSENEVAELVAKYNNGYYTSANELGTPEKQAALDFQKADNSLQYEQALDRLNVPEKSANMESGELEIKKLNQEIEKKRTQAIKNAEDEFAKIYDNLKGDKWYHVLGRILLPLARSLVTRGINSYFDSAGATLGRRTFTPPPAPSVTTRNNYTTNYNY